MNKELLKYLDTVNEDIQREVSAGRINGEPFARYANDAAAIFKGINVVMEMLQVDSIIDDDDGLENILNDYERGALESFVRVVAITMGERADKLMEWAKDRMKKSGGSHE